MDFLEPYLAGPMSNYNEKAEHLVAMQYRRAEAKHSNIELNNKYRTRSLESLMIDVNGKCDLHFVASFCYGNKIALLKHFLRFLKTIPKS